MSPPDSNIFEKLGFEHEAATNLVIRAQLMAALTEFIKNEKLTQAQAAEMLGVPQPRVSNITNGHIDKFTIDKLVNMAARVGLETQVRVTSDGKVLKVIDGGTLRPGRDKSTPPRRAAVGKTGRKPAVKRGSKRH